VPPSSAYRITVVDVRDFKRLDHVRIEPEADTSLLLIAGNNGNGKSSLLDAMTALFGGGRELPPDPVRHGRSRASIEGRIVRLDGVEYTITRDITRGKSGSNLQVVGPDGLIKSPQAWLDKLIGSRFLDPLSFLSMKGPEQRKLLLEVCGVDVAGIEAERAKAFAERTNVNRDLARAKGEYERLPAPTSSPGEARPMSEITAELQAATAAHADIATRRTALTQARRAVEEIDSRIGELRAELEHLEAKRKGAAVIARQHEEEVHLTATIDHETAATQRIADLRAEAARAETYARWSAGKAVEDRRRREAEAAVNERSQRAEHLTETIELCDRRKAEALSAAAMPVPDLTVDDEGLRLGGVPFEQASQSERLRCALGVAEKLSPGLRDVWVRDGSLLDDQAIETLRELAVASGCRIWIERVGERDPGAIILREGAVVSPAP
jgi:DNA repair exonuclease SbcCD ATPase subunit